MRVAFIVGSLRRDSYSRQLARAIMDLAPKTLQGEIVEIGSLSLYNQDEDEKPPQGWTTFRQALKGFDGVVFVTPEYNRSVPGVLKNAIDIGSRPYGQSVWSGKPAAIVSQSPGAMGGFGANHHLRQSLVFLDMPAMAQPEMYVGHVNKMFGPDGSVLEPGTKAFLSKFGEAFAVWVERHLARS